MKLGDLLDSQRELNAEMGNPMGSGEASAKENVLALIVEATEVLDEVNWKPWRHVTKRVKVVDRARLKEELVDVLQFWANIVNDMGFTEGEMAEAYYAKTKVCYERLREQRQLEHVTKATEGGAT